MGSEVEVRAARLPGGGQRFRLTVAGDEQVWSVRQWGFKPRAGTFAPWWYSEGLTWHLFSGELPEGGPDDAPPPLASFASMDEAKAHVLSLAGGRAAG
ncbi:hypothetical protein ACFPC0_10570 [Streptomyces andamanensis]|uniref:Uncharacterized protein n=1 Tax=Streptomyces andamanensis TaxID=1565035 RepID=A0ABV8TCD9_9ACTN